MHARRAPARNIVCSASGAASRSRGRFIHTESALAEASKKTERLSMKRIPGMAIAALFVALTPRLASPQSGAFRIEEASISDMHRAIQSGQVTCTDIVQAYIERAKAYNGTCTAL